MQTDAWQMVQDGIRIAIVGLGFALAMVAVRFAWFAWKRGETFRVFGILAFGFLVITPAIISIQRFREPLLGLVLGLVALRANYTVAPTWYRLGGKARARSDAKRDAAR
jgi:predicted membrane channel-forming protein YqfA (hemolysin III family)